MTSLPTFFRQRCCVTNKPIVFCMIWSAATVSFADAQECRLPRTLRGNSESIRFCQQSHAGDYLSESCLKGKCQVLGLIEATVRTPIPLSPSELAGGKNPGSLACSKAGGEVRILRDEDGDEQSYCQSGRDGSMASTALLKWRLSDGSP